MINFECKTNENYNDVCKDVVVENKEINVESDEKDFVEVEFSNEDVYKRQILYF